MSKNNKQSTPKRQVPKVVALKNFIPSIAQGWSFTEGTFLKAQAAVTITSGFAPQIIGQKKTSNRKKKDVLHDVIICAVMGGANPQYWGKLQVDPSISVIFTSAQEVSNAVHAHEAIRRDRMKSTRYSSHITAASTISSTDPCIGDFASFHPNMPVWLQSLDIFH